MKFSLVLLVIPVILFVNTACDDKNTKCTESNISANFENESHNNGQNCVSCHKSGGEGKGCFNVCGSVYTSATSSSSLANVTVKFYTQPNGQGTLKYTVKGDAKGNFFTTEDMAVAGLYPAITGPTGTKYMGSALTSGSCNSCHGSSTDKLWAD